MAVQKISWLDTIGVLPKMISTALQYVGVREIAGVANNPVIMEMAKGLGVDDIFTSDDKQAWCAVFVNHVIRISGKPIDLHPADKYDLIRARKVGKEFDAVSIDDWRLGDIMILKRNGGGHVFFPIASTGKGIIGLGGNQGNEVSFAEFSKDRVIAVKRYYKTAMPESAKQYVMSSSGKISENEV